MIEVEKETFDKMVSVLAKLPYVQVAGLMAEIGTNSRQGHDRDNDAGMERNSVHNATDDNGSQIHIDTVNQSGGVRVGA